MDSANRMVRYYSSCTCEGVARACPCDRMTCDFMVYVEIYINGEGPYYEPDGSDYSWIEDEWENVDDDEAFGGGAFGEENVEDEEELTAKTEPLAAKTEPSGEGLSNS